MTKLFNFSILNLYVSIYIESLIPYSHSQSRHFIFFTGIQAGF